MSGPLQRILVSPQPVYVGQDSANDRRNLISELASVRDLARVAVQNPEILFAIAPFVSASATLGFAARRTADLRRMVFVLDPHSSGKVAYLALERLSEQYDQRIAALDASETPENLAGQFTSAISERITYELLLQAGVKQEDIRSDASFWIGEPPERINSRNLDYSWSTTLATGLYECKNQPMTILRAYGKKDRPGERAEWLKSKCNLMLTVAGALRGGDVRVHLACVSLRSRAVADIEDIAIPPLLQIYCADELPSQFVNDVAETLKHNA